jgi:hypothetical protein
MRVLVTGATTWSDVEAIRADLGRLPAGSVVIHGDAPGADALAGQVARELGLTAVRMAKAGGLGNGAHHPRTNVPEGHRGGVHRRGLACRP